MVKKITFEKLFHTNLLLPQEKGSVHVRYLVENGHTSTMPAKSSWNTNTV